MASKDVTPLFSKAASMFNMDPLLPQAVAQVESGGESDPDRAVSSAGALGRMQLMPANISRMNIKDPTNAEQNIMGGTSMLDEALTAAHGNVPLALRYYQGGQDQTKWGPQNAAYPAKVGAAYARLAAQQSAGAPAASPHVAVPAVTPGATPTAQPDSVDAFLSGALPTAVGSAKPATVAAPSPAAPAQSPDAIDTFLSGATPATAAPPAAPVAAAAPKAPMVVEPGSTQANQTSSAATSAQAYLEPAPNTTYGTILPLAKDNTTGAIRLALPSSIRSLASGLVDLVDGPNTGQVTPEATNALAAVVTGGAGEGVANALTGSLPRAGSAALRAGSALMPGKSSYAANALAGTQQVADEAAMKTLAANPFAPGFTPPAASANAALPANGLAGSAAPPVAAAPYVNPLTGTPAPSSPLLAAPPPEVSASIPNGLPSRPILPIMTSAQADARANAIIQHFAGNGPKDINSNALVMGSKPTLAQATGNPGLATLERGFQGANPEPFALRSQTNAAARVQALNNVIGSPADIAAAETVRDVTTSAAKQAAFAKTSPVDPTPVVSQIDSILSGPQGQRPGVAAPLQAIRNSLVQTDPQTGAVTMQTDPQQLWGIRQFMNDMISPKAAGTPSDGRMAAAQLSDLKSTLDPIIEQGAPGFGKFLSAYSDASQPIDGMRYLQSLNLTDANGMTTLAKLDGAIKGIERQQAQPGIRSASAVSDDQLSSLKFLRDDMRRESNSSLGKSLGSNTFQNFSTNALTGTLGSPIVQGLSGAGGGALGGYPGAAAGYLASKGLNALSGRGELMVRQALANKLLNPEVGVNALAVGKPPKPSP